MNTLVTIFRRLGLLLVGVVIVAAADASAANNWFDVAVGAALLLPVLFWAVRPAELKADSLEGTLKYALLPTVGAGALALLVAGLALDVTPAEFGGMSTLAFVAAAAAGILMQVRLRTRWARTGKHPMWVQVLAPALGMMGANLAAARAAGASRSFDSNGSRDSLFDDHRTNPVTGQTMIGGIGGFDASGNTWVHSSSNNTTSFNSNEPF